MISMRPNKWLLLVCAAVGALVVVGNGGDILGGTLRRSLQADHAPQHTKLFDDRPICSGPRRDERDNDLLLEPLYKRASYGLPLGKDKPFGRFNNKVVQLFNAVDSALDSGGVTTVVVSGWVIEWMNVFFPSEDSWRQLERQFPIVRVNDTHDLNLQDLGGGTADFMSRSLPHLKPSQSVETIQARRTRLLHYMFSNLDGEPCHFLNQVQGYVKGKYEQSKYVAVHMRNMEGNCETFNDSPFRKEQCSMSPLYIKSILDNHGDTGKLPIVALSDMQDEAKLHLIHDELDRVVVPEWDIGRDIIKENDQLHESGWDPGPAESIIADMVVGATSEIFIGEQGSSGSRNIAILREAFGKPVSTNYVFMNKTADGDWSNYHPKRPYDWWVGVAKQ
jgi:hypothetical protein